MVSVMKRYLLYTTACLLSLCGMLTSCDDELSEKEQKNYYVFLQVQDNTKQVLWNPSDYDFEKGNHYYMERYEKAAEALSGGCSSWRNGNFHGRNLDWFMADYGCLIVQMPKGNGVRHASVGLINGSTSVTKAFLKGETLTAEQKATMPCATVDGINDAGVACNINIVPYAPGDKFVGKEGDLSAVCVVRFVLDNADNVDDAIAKLRTRKVRQDLVAVAGDETHYMISDARKTAVVEYVDGEMHVSYYQQTAGGCYSDKGNPAIMTNLYNYALEAYGLGTPEFYDHHPYPMGLERWNTIKDQYASAANDVESNLKIGQSVWYFKNFMADKVLWYSENAIATCYGKTDTGWWYKAGGERHEAADCPSAQKGFWDGFMPAYWQSYEDSYGKMTDPHVEGNDFWETSHTVVYNLQEKKGYLIPFENFYAADRSTLQPIEIALPR